MTKYIVELIGTFFLVLTIGTAFVLGTAGPLAPLAIGGMLVALVYAARHHSGAHFNPAITLAVFIRGRCVGKEVGPYILSQLAGAALAAVIVGKLLAPAALEPSQNIERFIIDRSGAVVASELLFSFALVYVYLNALTSRHTDGNTWFGLAIGFTAMAGAFTVGTISLAAFNPAVSTALAITGRLGWADVWMHFLPQLLGAVLAAFTFKGLNPEDS